MDDRDPAMDADQHSGSQASMNHEAADSDTGAPRTGRKRQRSARRPTATQAASPTSKTADHDRPRAETDRRARADAAGAENAANEPALRAIVEATLFSSDGPLSAGRIAEIVGAPTAASVRDEINSLNEDYAQTGRSFRINKLAGGYQMLTEPVFMPWLTRLHQDRSRSRLSNAAMETLAIVAYKQPIIRAEIDAIRGVASGDALNRLREMGLVKVVGRADLAGRPMLYGTAKKFLDVFGLCDLKELPPLEDIALQPSTPPSTIGPAEDAGAHADEPPPSRMSA